jgi:hypothetical protein
MTKGINNDVQATSRKKFSPNVMIDNGISRAIISGIEVTYADIENDSKMVTFRGKKIPRLVIHFESTMDKPGVKTSYYDHAYLPYEHNPDNVMNKKNAWKFDSIAQMIKHIHEVLSERALIKEEVDLMSFPIIETENGSFVEQDVDTIISGWTQWFNGIAAVFNGGYKIGDKEAPSLLVNADGTTIPLHVKLLLYSNNNEVNRGDAGLPMFPGEGVIQKIKKDIPCELRIKIEKGESIVPKAKTPLATSNKNIPGISATNTVVSDTDVPDYLKSGANTDLPY